MRNFLYAGEDKSLVIPYEKQNVIMSKFYIKNLDICTFIANLIATGIGIEKKCIFANEIDERSRAMQKKHL